MNEIPSIGPIRQSDPLAAVTKSKSAAQQGVSFKDTLNDFIKDVNSMQVKASDSIQKLAAGEITDVHQVMSTAEEATVAFNMMMEIRNKVMDAYQEVMRIRL